MPALPDVDPDELAALRSRANAYVRELHARRSGLDLSAYDAMSHLARFEATVRSDFAVPNLRSWSAAMLADAREKVSLLDARLARLGEPTTHPWRAVGLTRLGPDAKQRIRSQLGPLRATLVLLRAAGAQLAPLLGRGLHDHCGRPLTSRCGRTRSEAAWLTSCPATGATGAGAPRAVSIPCWRTPEARSVLRREWEPVFSPEAELHQWTDVLVRRQEGPGLFRWLGATWRDDTRRLIAATPTGKLPPRPALVNALGALAKSAALRAAVEKNGAGLADLLAHTWAGVDTDWHAVEMTVRGARLVQRLAVENGLHDDVVSRCLSQRPELLRVAERASAAGKIFRDAWSVWTT